MSLISRQQNAILQRGIALSPNYSLAEMEYSLYLDAMNRSEEAVAHIGEATRSLILFRS